MSDRVEWPPFCRPVDGGLEITVKVIPGSSRDRVVGPLGNALKIQVAAPPERGKANAAVVSMMARALGVTERQVELTSGATSPRKVLRIAGMTVAEVRRALQV